MQQSPSCEWQWDPLLAEQERDAVPPARWGHSATLIDRGAQPVPIRGTVRRLSLFFHHLSLCFHHLSLFFHRGSGANGEKGPRCVCTRYPRSV